MAGAVLGLTVFCMVLGSSSSPELVGPGRKLRWIALFALAVVGVVLAARERRRGEKHVPTVVLALAAWLAAVGIVSTAWSADPRLTFGRAGSFALLFVAVGALACAAPSRPRLPVRLLQGILAGTVLAALGGLAMLVVAHGEAVQPASTLYPARFRGLGENPNTAAMLEGVVVPLALWALVRARRRAEQALWLAVLLLLFGSISASGSRGGLIAAFLGGALFSLALPVAWRRRLALGLAVCVATAGATAATQIPKPHPPVAAPTSSPSGPGGQKLPTPIGQPVGASEPGYAGRLADELWRVQQGQRSLFSSSGRLKAWYTAIQQADARPVLGYGFGTENKVFESRVYGFEGDYVENSFIGFYLQLGAVGLVSVLLLLLAVCVAGWHAIRRADPDALAPALASVVVAGLSLMLAQSYMYSVGNVATVTFWTACFAVAALGPGALSARAAPLLEGTVEAA